MSVEYVASSFIGNNAPLNDFNLDLASSVRRSLRESLVPSMLCIMAGRFVWCLQIDALVLSNNGSVLDAVSCAVWAALMDTRLPFLKPVRAQAGFEDDFIFDMSSTKALPLEVGCLPINITLTRIGDAFVVGATQHEESCATSQIHVAVNRMGDFFGLCQAGDDPIALERVAVVLQLAKQTALALLKGLEKARESRLSSFLS